MHAPTLTFRRCSSISRYWDPVADMSPFERCRLEPYRPGDVSSWATEPPAPISLHTPAREALYTSSEQMQVAVVAPAILATVRWGRCQESLLLLSALPVPGWPRLFVFKVLRHAPSRQQWRLLKNTSNRSSVQRGGPKSQRHSIGYRVPFEIETWTKMFDPQKTAPSSGSAKSMWTLVLIPSPKFEDRNT